MTWKPRKYDDIESAWNGENVPRGMKVKEKSVEQALVRAVKRVGGRAYKFTSPAQRSVPDRLIILPGQPAFFVECKRPGGKLTTLQEIEVERIRELGTDVFIIDSPEAAQKLIQEKAEPREMSLLRLYTEQVGIFKK